MSASDLILAAGAPASRARVRVPATSANLGCGFDCLGLALTLYNEFLFEAAPRLSFEGCEARFANDHHLAYTAWRRTLRSLADESQGSAALCDPAKVHLSTASQVPLSGGLGSSSTCIVAGIVAAYAMAGAALTREELLERATQAEGHPDNVAPASLGGLTCSFIAPEGQVVSLESPVDPRWRFVAVSPAYEVRTSEARRVLPPSVPLEDAVWCLGRCQGTIRALETGDGALLRAACADRLHEPYRKALIPDYEPLKELALRLGAAAFWISGSGSTMMAACLDDQTAADLCKAVRQLSPTVAARILMADNQGAVLCER